MRANPEVHTVVKGINICRENNIEAVLAVGGGSCYDTSKAIIVGACMPKSEKAEDIW